MPITSAELLLKQSGASNLGGAIQATDVSSSLHGLFDVVLGYESLVGSIEHRCVYIKNNHATLTLYAPVVFISSNTPSASTSADVGVGTAGVSAQEQVIANDKVAPSGVVFSSPSDYLSGLPLGDLAPGAYRAIWIRRTVNAGASSYNNDGLTLSVQGDTAA